MVTCQRGIRVCNDLILGQLLISSAVMPTPSVLVLLLLLVFSVFVSAADLYKALERQSKARTEWHNRPFD